MIAYKKTKTITILFFAIAIAIFPSAEAHAQFAVAEANPATLALFAAIAASTAVTAQSVVAGPASAGLAAADTLAACDKVDTAQQVAGAGGSGAGSFAGIGESPAETVALTAQIAALLTIKGCDQAKLDFYKIQPILTLVQGQELQRRQQALTTEISALSLRIESLKQQQSASVKDITKAVALRIILTFSQKLTTKLINALVQKYKISNYLQYADAVSTQIYTSDFVTKNYPLASNQLIMRSVLQNQGYQDKVLPLVRQETSDALGFDTNSLSFAQPDYYAKLASAGNGNTNPYYVQELYNGRAQLAKAQGDASAQTEISQGKGFIPVRNCSGAVAQQKGIDQQNVQLSKDVYTAQEVYTRLNSAKFVDNLNVKDADLKKAAADLATAQSKLKALPAAEPQPIVKMCEGITNPAAFLGDGIQNLVKKQLDDVSNLKSENLPFYASFISSVATNLLNNILEGGRSNISLLTEDGFKASNIVANQLVTSADENHQIQQITSQTGNSDNSLVQTTQSNVTLLATSTQSTSTFKLVWDASQNPNVAFVTIKGGVGLPTAVLNETPLGKTTSINVIRSTAEQTYILSLYKKGDIPGQPGVVPLDQLSITVPPPPAPSFNNNSAPIVFGASTAKPTASIRGPAVEFHPRGK